jgi:hypothetical protein
MDAETDIAPEIAEYPEAGPFWVGLWAVAQHWVAVLAHVFEPGFLAGPGVTRRFALLCRNWLWPIEGLVRRLIIAAAMKLDASQLPEPVAGRTARTPARPAAPSVAFSVLPRLPGRGAARPGARKPPPEHRHLVFPGDGLLNLFPRHDRRNARPSPVRTRNPLHRRGRIGRWDPDYQGEAPPLFRDRRPMPPGDIALPDLRRHSRADASPCSSANLPEWKRIDQEWERVIPAPRLSARISALARVMAAPERWIARAARKLGADLVAAIRAAPPPKLKKPKLDRNPSGFLEDPLAQAQALFDTS